MDNVDTASVSDDEEESAEVLDEVVNSDDE